MPEVNNKNGNTPEPFYKKSFYYKGRSGYLKRVDRDAIETKFNESKAQILQNIKKQIDLLPYFIQNSPIANFGYVDEIKDGALIYEIHFYIDNEATAQEQEILKQKIDSVYKNIKFEQGIKKSITLEDDEKVGKVLNVLNHIEQIPNDLIKNVRSNTLYQAQPLLDKDEFLEKEIYSYISILNDFGAHNSGKHVNKVKEGLAHKFSREIPEIVVQKIR